ncbi:MAG: glycogen/starch synthase [Muribaculaceae bacterium]|nr:glycogen/starch synthase [Muribaculaceae bacterium]
MLDLLFETSWEVCNKVGGIYAVLSTKAKTLQKSYKDKVVFIGPDLWSDGHESPYFIETKTPLDAWARQAVLPAAMTVRTGRWNVPGKPLVVLVNYHSLFPYKNNLYADMWSRFGVDSLHGYGDYDESCMFAYAAALAIESMVKWSGAQRVVAHFDEWTTGMGLLYVKANLPQVATVFTTHATSIGRSISGNGKPLYDYMAGYNGDQMAGELNMQSKHSLEKAAAHAADAFTTVSEVTARECEQLLERRPLVTPNAFEQNFVPRGEKLPHARVGARECLLRVASSLTGVQYAPDTLLVATSGRCEFRNKGIDLYLDALNSLRFTLGRLSSVERRVVAFVLVPAWVQAPRADLADAVAAGRTSRLFNPVITHSLHNEDSDVIYGKINYLGMRNDLHDRVHVIYVPSYLDGRDGIFDMTYYDLLPGLDLTVFPSYYEPWGYTPLESVAFGVPTVTTNLAGFGQWVLDNRGGNAKKSGVRVISRTDSNYSDAVDAIAGSMMNVFMMADTEMRRIRTHARGTGRLASWTHFMDSYTVAYLQALACAKSRTESMITHDYDSYL